MPVRSCPLGLAWTRVMHSNAHIVRNPSPADGTSGLTAQRLQALFHSLCRVLLIFRSHYLFAIGLTPIFSLARDTPGGCTALPNSTTRGNQKKLPSGPSTNGTLTLHGGPFQDTLAKPLGSPGTLCYNSMGFRIPNDSRMGCSLFGRPY